MIFSCQFRELSKIAIKRPPSKGASFTGKKRKNDMPTKLSKFSQNELILVGVNAVTKALERRPLSLVLVCNSARPVDMTHHLISLCAMRDTSGCCLSGLSRTLSEILGIKSVLAVGFVERKENPLQDLLEFIKDKAPPLNVPWVNVWKNDPLLRKEPYIAEGSNDLNKCDEREEIDREGASVLNISTKKLDESNENSFTKESQINEPAISGKNKDCNYSNIATSIEDNRPTSDNNAAQKCSCDINEHKRGQKRTLDGVGYRLYDTSFKYKEVSVRTKKKPKNK